jgi:hypothetical protein
MANHHSSDIVVLKDGSYSFSPYTGLVKKKVLLNSFPKSGTYMFAKFLEIIGLINTGVHLSSGGFWDFRRIPVAEVIRAPEDFLVLLPLEQTCSLIRNGQFSVGHVEYSDYSLGCIRGFAHILCVRNVRDALVSHMRFIMDDRRRDRPSGAWWQVTDNAARFLGYLQDPGQEFIKGLRLQLPWLDHDDVLICRFEEAMGDYGFEAQKALFERIDDLLGLDPKKGHLSLFNMQVIGKETRTYSGLRSRYAEYWSRKAEEIYHEIGAHKVNSIIGYE